MNVECITLTGKTLGLVSKVQQKEFQDAVNVECVTWTGKTLGLVSKVQQKAKPIDQKERKKMRMRAEKRAVGSDDGRSGAQCVHWLVACL